MSEGDIGVDMGGTRIKAGRVVAGRIVEQRAIPTAGGAPEELLDRIAKLVQELDPAPRSLGFAIPGEIDRAGVCWRLPNVPGFAGLNIGQELAARLGCQVVVQNDATAAALGELKHGFGQRYRDLLVVMLGTGVGGGLVLDGAVRSGARGFAGEIGHLQLSRAPDAPEDSAGLRGTLEAYAGTQALLTSFYELGGQGTEVRVIADSARRGEAAGRVTFERMASALGEGIISLQHVLDVEAVVFSGGISGAFDLIEAPLRAAMRARAYAEPLAEVPLLVSELGDAAGIVGAALLPRFMSPP